MQISLRDELHNVISGKSQVRHGSIIQTVTSYLDDGKQASRNHPEEKRLKKHESAKLENLISKENLWINNQKKWNF
jgi:hypothetical protein